MARFEVTVVETYTATFFVDAEDADGAESMAEAMAVGRQFPEEHDESCSRQIHVDPQQPTRSAP